MPSIPAVDCHAAPKAPAQLSRAQKLPEALSAEQREQAMASAWPARGALTPRTAAGMAREVHSVRLRAECSEIGASHLQQLSVLPCKAGPSTTHALCSIQDTETQINVEWDSSTYALVAAARQDSTWT